jgi:hypothetical protein
MLKNTNFLRKEEMKAVKQFCTYDLAHMCIFLQRKSRACLKSLEDPAPKKAIEKQLQGSSLSLLAAPEGKETCA